jgi:cGMP-dependent protein kinase 2
VRCDNCEKACAETHHGVSRLNREAGPTYATLHVPTSCRHCEDPHCMKDCPPDAIHRAPNGEVFIADNCIGCGNCERNCPYGVIQMAATPPEKPGLLHWLLFGMGYGPGEDKSPAAVAKRTGSKHAVKCDMCKDIDGGPACVRACPTGAAIRVAPEQFIGAIRQGGI